MNRKFWISFLAIQIIGEACFWFWPLLPKLIQPALWVIGFLFRLPGSQGSEMLVEHFLGMNASRMQLLLVELPVEVLFNAVVWVAVGSLIRYLFINLVRE